MKKFYRILSVAVSVMLVIGLAACTKKQEDVKTSKKSEKAGINIGITFDTFVLERWQRDRDVFVATAESLGAKVNVQNANGDVKKQREHIEEFTEQGMDVIVVVAVDCYGLKSAISDARSKGISVISYDRLIQNTKTDLYVTVDSELVGREMALQMKKALPNGGNVAMICGPKADTNSGEVTEGFETEIKGSNLKVVYKTNVEAWVPEYGFTFTNEAFEKVNDISAVMCANDGIAGQAIRALSEKQLAGKVYVTGQDADLEACQRVVENTQLTTIYKPIQELAKVAAEKSVELAKGKLTGVSDVRECDAGEVAYIGLEPMAITKENMEKFLEDTKFHVRDEVYLNVK